MSFSGKWGLGAAGSKPPPQSATSRHASRRFCMVRFRRLARVISDSRVFSSVMTGLPVGNVVLIPLANWRARGFVLVPTLQRGNAIRAAEQRGAPTLERGSQTRGAFSYLELLLGQRQD